MLKAKTFVKEVDRNSGLGRIYSYRYGKKKKKDTIDGFLDENEGRSSVSTDVPDGMFHTSEGPSRVSVKKQAPVLKSFPTAKAPVLKSFPTAKAPVLKSIPAAKATVKRGSGTSGVLRITPKQYKEAPSTSSYKPKYIGVDSSKSKVKGYKSESSAARSASYPLKESRSNLGVDTTFKKPKFEASETPARSGMSYADLQRMDRERMPKKRETEYGVPKYLDPNSAGPEKKFDIEKDLMNVVPKGISRGELGLKQKKSPTYGMPYSNAQQEQLRKSDVKVGGGSKRAGSLAVIAGAGLLGPLLLRGLKGGKKTPKQIPRSNPQIPYRGKPGETIVLPPKGGPLVPKSTVRWNPPKTRIGINKSITNTQPYNQKYGTGSKTPKSPRDATRMTRRNAKDLYKNYNPKKKYDGQIVKTPKSVLKAFMKNRK